MGSNNNNIEYNNKINNMDSLDVEGVPWYVSILLGVIAFAFHNLVDVVTWYHHVLDFLLSTGALIIMAFKVYEIYNKYIRK